MKIWPFHQPSVTLGTYGFGFLRLPFRLRGRDLLTHMHVMGLTGQGKSRLLATYLAQMIQQGRSAALIDPHGDLADDVLGLLHDAAYFQRDNAFERLWYVDFSRQDRFVPFNVLKQPYESHAVAQHILEVAQRVWPSLGQGQAPQFENVLLASVIVLVENARPLTDLPRLLTDRAFREDLLRRVTDPHVTSFFHNRFDHWGKDTALLLESTLRRVFLLAFSPTLRYSLSQPDNRLDFRALMDGHVSLICNLAGLDEQTQRFLGCLLTVGFEQAALSRSDLAPQERAPYHLVIDEFSPFSAQSDQAMIRVLTLARKYGLFLTLAHQTWSQLSSRLQGALQNTVQVAFRLGRDDAVWAAPRFGRVDPEAVKHEVSDPAWQGRTHPLYYTSQDDLEAWAQALEDLPPREAYVHVGNRTARIHTKHVQPHVDSAALSAIKERYAQRLMTPRSEIQELGEQRAPSDDIEIFRAVPQPSDDPAPPLSPAVHHTPTTSTAAPDDERERGGSQRRKTERERR